MRKRDLERFILLFHHRWALPVLAELHRTRGAKFVTLVNRLAANRVSLHHALDILVEEGWVKRNPGHGHPLRPEYLLTGAGEDLAPWCARILAILAALGIEDVALRKWSLPVVFALRQGRDRFSEVRTFLPGLTPRALVLTLKNLQHAGLVDRSVTNGYPPTSHYRLTRPGRELSALLDSLSR